jgi:transposase-like protein
MSCQTGPDQIKQAFKDHPEWLQLSHREVARRMVEYGYSERSHEALRKAIDRLVASNEISKDVPSEQPEQSASPEQPTSEEIDKDALIAQGVQQLQERYFYNEFQDKYVILEGYASGSVIEGERIRTIQKQYANMGDGASVNEICREHGWTPDFFNGVRRALGMTHSSLPLTHEEVASTIGDPEAEARAAQNLVMMQSNKLYRKMQRQMWKHTEKQAQWAEEFKARRIDPFAKMVANNPARRKVFKIGGIDEGHHLLCTASDVHVGARSVDGRGLSDTRERLIGSTHTLVERAAPYGRPDGVTVLYNGDFFHVDNPKGETSAGTPQDLACSPDEAIRFGIDLAIEQIDLLRSLGHVTVYVTRGNHDNNTSYMLGLLLGFAYQNVDDVTIIEQTFNPWYITMIGGAMCYFEHGDGPKQKDIVEIMATHEPQMWAKCPYKYAFTGHLHHERSWDKGILHRQLRSLALPDRWHNKNGYNLAKKGVEAFAFAPDGELMAEFRATLLR